MTTKYKICTQCVMDESDPNISFSETGECSYCQYFAENMKHFVKTGKDAEEFLARDISEIKSRRKGEYDCILGLSGGVDSSYLALKAIDWGLKPLAVHVDAGWNSELAVKNIDSIVNKLGLDLITVVIDWDSMKNLQRAFLRSGIANQDIPQDHAFFASLYRIAEKHKIRSILTGSNYATESVLPRAWGYTASDATFIKSVFSNFSQPGEQMKSFPLMSVNHFHLMTLGFHKVKIFSPLNYLPYQKDIAIQELKERLEWKPYSRKHGESRFTKFFQNHYLIKKWGYDKRKAHLSSLIISGQMTRDEAISELKKPVYDEAELKDDLEFVLKKLEFSNQEFDQFLKAPNNDGSKLKKDTAQRNFWQGNRGAKIKSFLNKI